MLKAQPTSKTALLWGPLDGQVITVEGMPGEIVLPWPLGVAKPRGAVYERKAVLFALGEGSGTNVTESWDVRYVWKGWRRSP